MENNIIYLTDDIFEEKISKIKKTILLDFWAEWCNPCKIISPILDEISEEYQEYLIISKINIDQNPNTVLKYNVQSIPTFLLIKNKKVIANKIGMTSKKELKEFLDKNLMKTNFESS